MADKTAKASTDMIQKERNVGMLSSFSEILPGSSGFQCKDQSQVINP